MNRRRLLGALATGGALALAGCSGTDGGAGSDADGTGSGGGGTGDGTAQAPDGNPPGTPGSEPTATETPTGTEGPPTTGAPGTDAPTLGSVGTTFADNYRFRMDFSGYEAESVDMTAEGRWHGADYTVSMTVSDGASGPMDFEIYVVDGRTSTVMDGQCFAQPGSMPSSVDVESWSDNEGTEARFDEWAEITAVGTRTVDGEVLHEFRLGADDNDGIQYDVTYLVSAASGHLRRVETQGVVMEYWDWGSAPPVQAPC